MLAKWLTLVRSKLFEGNSVDGEGEFPFVFNCYVCDGKKIPGHARLGKRRDLANASRPSRALKSAERLNRLAAFVVVNGQHGPPNH